MLCHWLAFYIAYYI